jgi:hypothetical protein
MEYIFILADAAPSSVKCLVAALSALYKCNGMKSLSDNELVRRAVEGVERERPKTAKTLPLPVEALNHHLSKGLEGNWDWLVTAISVGLGMRLLWRASSISSILLDDISFTAVAGKRAAKIISRKSKTNQRGVEQVFWLEECSVKRLCLVNILEKYLVLRRRLSSPHPHLLLSSKGSPLTTNLITGFVKSVAKNAGLKDKYSSRSLRVGGVTWMVESGFNWADIVASGWAEGSSAAKDYVRNVAIVKANATDKMFGIQSSQVRSGLSGVGDIQRKRNSLSYGEVRTSSSPSKRTLVLTNNGERD